MTCSHIRKSVVAAALAIASASASAAYINGAFSISGAVNPLPTSPINTATGLDFTGTISPSLCVDDLLTIVGGNSLTCNGATASMQDIAAGTIVGTGTVSITVNLDNWITLSIGGVAFDLSTITKIERTAQDGLIPAELTITGTGVMQATGWQDTQGGFRLTANGTSTSFSFSSTQISAGSAPEPGTLALFGLALAGLGLVRRRK